MFTSIDEGASFGGKIQLIIETKKAKYIAPLSEYENEEEALIKSGSQFRVVKHEVKYGNDIFTLVDI
jgi:hypothetical protein